MKNKWNLLLFLLFLTCSCGLIDEKDTLPQKEEKAVQNNSRDLPSRGNG